MSFTHARASRLAPGRGPRHEAASSGSLESSVLRLQALAGNRATAGVLGAPTVQRAPGVDRNAGGELLLPGEAPVRIQSASWSAERSTKNFGDDGRTRGFEPTSSRLGELVIHREADGSSPAFAALYARLGMDAKDSGETATLNLKRPSIGGRLPATSIRLIGVRATTLAIGRGEGRTEKLTLDADDLSFAGMDRAAAPTAGIGSLQVGEPLGDAWGSLRVLSWQHHSERGEFPRVVAKVVADRHLDRLYRALREGHFQTFAYRPRTGAEVRLEMGLLTRVASTSDGPDTVEVRIKAER